MQQPQVNIDPHPDARQPGRRARAVNRPALPRSDHQHPASATQLAAAGGAPSGDDVAIVTGVRNGKPFRKTVDIPALYLTEGSADDIPLRAATPSITSRPSSTSTAKPSVPAPTASNAA